MGESWSRFFSPGGVQRVWSQPMGMKTNPRRRRGLAGVLSRAVAAGTIASSNGSAMVTPMPRKNVRRGIAFLVRIIAVSSFNTGFHEYLFNTNDVSLHRENRNARLRRWEFVFPRFSGRQFSCSSPGQEHLAPDGNGLVLGSPKENATF
jgi:hypothetical protein